MKKKLISFSDEQVLFIEEIALARGITFSEALRRMLDELRGEKILSEREKKDKPQ
jgi:hypothetical protein